MKRLTKILASVFGAGLFASLVVGSTLALYTSEKTVNNHLVSGDMQAMLYLKSLQNDVLENNGHITEDVATDLSDYDGYAEGLSYKDHDNNGQVVNFNGVNLATYADEVFAVEKVVPTMRGSAEFVILNNGATDASDSVAFEFAIELEDATGDEELIEQVDIELENADWDNNYVACGYGKAFTVKWEFKDLTNNNDAQNMSLAFDITVTCVQETAQHD